jgi:hypothetical protein
MNVEQKSRKGAKVVSDAVLARGNVSCQSVCFARVKSDMPEGNEEQCENYLAHLAHHEKTLEISGVSCELRGVPVGTPRTPQPGTPRGKLTPGENDAAGRNAENVEGAETKSKEMCYLADQRYASCLFLEPQRDDGTKNTRRH